MSNENLTSEDVIEGDELEEVEKLIRAYGVNKLRRMLGKSYQWLNQKLNGYAPLYRSDLDLFRKSMNA